MGFADLFMRILVGMLLFAAFVFCVRAVYSLFA